jgi:Zn-dependent protease/predicted transcriptional regulator
MRALRIGRIFGIDLRVDWSWALIVLLLTWNLVAVFSRWHPTWPPLGALVVAVSASLVFFACVLLHELAHSVVAMRYGVRVRSITLFLFGGVSNIEQEPPSAKAEFFTAIVGPITSILLGIGFLVLASVVTAVSMSHAEGMLTTAAQLGPLATLLVWLGPINIMIGLFNMIPGFPLDGGRVLRSVLWSVTGDLRVATRGASAVGQGVGGLFILAGIAMTFGARLPFFGTGLVGGLWLAFIGWFLHGAAAQAYTRLALDDALAGVVVEQLMRRNGPSVAPEMSVAELVHDHLIRGDERALPVMTDGKLLGLVSFSNVRDVSPAQWASTQVGSIMRRVDSLSVTTPEQSLAKAFEQLAEKNIAQLPVLVDGRLVGMLLRLDIARWLELAWRPGLSGRANITTRPSLHSGSGAAQQATH